ncbi:MAG: CDP-glucose 4,6-dehydratase [Rhodospirillaceae bacterium]|jgi:CDP-glucose 4,6-dehydratase|nr:CDP-glucose 4,6-dehydratase [Rhodospirillaceae bacterium]MBT6136320.1 CDP-glucose 4,6-dehydratase [Rhodospirillaceae bacterium]
MSQFPRQFSGAYQGRKVLLTGHTGFKGSWLALWLDSLGADVTALALPPETTPNHWDLLGLDLTGHDQDIRDASGVSRIVAEAAPDIVFHLAAQPLVRRSYRDPLETWSTNVMGTANVLEACRAAPSVRAIVSVTTDKCYQNQEWVWGYRENDRLGGHDPYSASKAAAELVSQSYRSAFFAADDGPLLATARAGNVIGGGDWSEDRLIPDLVRAMATGEDLEVRSPNATRPWQHVLESLSGYLLLGQRLLDGDKATAEAWNFGPDSDGNRTVETVLTTIRDNWPEVHWSQSAGEHPHEAGLLQLDCTKARQELGWRPVWSFEEGVAATAQWYRAWLEDECLTSRDQLARFVAEAAAKGLVWAGDAA